MFSYLYAIDVTNFVIWIIVNFNINISIYEAERHFVLPHLFILCRNASNDFRQNLFRPNFVKMGEEGRILEYYQSKFIIKMHMQRRTSCPDILPLAPFCQTQI